MAVSAWRKERFMVRWRVWMLSQPAVFVVVNVAVSVDSVKSVPCQR